MLDFCAPHLCLADMPLPATDAVARFDVFLSKQLGTAGH